MPNTNDQLKKNFQRAKTVVASHKARKAEYDEAVADYANYPLDRVPRNVQTRLRVCDDSYNRGQNETVELLESLLTLLKLHGLE